MINLLSIPFSEKSQQLIEDSISNYWRFARIEVLIEPGKQLNEYNVFISQKELVNDRILSEEELVERGRKIFEGLIPDGYNLNYIPKSYAL